MPDKRDFQLKRIAESDKGTIYDWRNKKSVRQYMYTDHLISIDEHENWFQSIMKDSGVNKYYMFYVHGVPYGFVSITDINLVHKTCSWAFYIGPENPPIGTGAAMEYFALETIFDVMDIRKLSCEVLSTNEAVIKLHKKFGFSQEGVLKEQIYKYGNYADVVLLSIFKEQWHDKKERMAKICFRKRTLSC